MIGKPLSKPRQSVEQYIRSIGRHYLNAVIVMTLLITATYLTMLVALDRHSLQQKISFLTSNQFIRFQQLANQTRALMRASADPTLPQYIIIPMRDDIHRAIGDIRAIKTELHDLDRSISGNLLERLNPRAELTVQLRRELNARLEDFLGRATRIAEASAEDRRQRYSFWGPIDFAVATDSMLMRQFADLIRHAHDRSHVSIDNAKLISTGLLALIAATVILASTFLFSPLLKKLRNEHRQTMAFEKRLTLLAHTDALTGLNIRSRPSRRVIPNPDECQKIRRYRLPYPSRSRRILDRATELGSKMVATLFPSCSQREARPIHSDGRESSRRLFSLGQAAGAGKKPLTNCACVNSGSPLSPPTKTSQLIMYSALRWTPSIVAGR